MENKLKVITKLKTHGSDKIETQEMLVVLTKEENLDFLIQMTYGCWYDIIEYTYEPIEIYVSKKYCHQVSAQYLKKDR